MKALVMALTLLTTGQTFAEVAYRKCYDSTNFKNTNEIHLAFDTQDKQVINLLLTNTETDKTIQIKECVGSSFDQSEGELLEYGSGNFFAICKGVRGKTSVEYVNDYDEWKLYIKSEHSELSKTTEWMCE